MAAETAPGEQAVATARTTECLTAEGARGGMRIRPGARGAVLRGGAVLAGSRGGAWREARCLGEIDDYAIMRPQNPKHPNNHKVPLSCDVSVAIPVID
jgi:hypothetical protein